MESSELYLNLGKMLLYLVLLHPLAYTSSRRFISFPLQIIPTDWAKSVFSGATQTVFSNIR